MSGLPRLLTALNPLDLRHAVLPADAVLAVRLLALLLLQSGVAPFEVFLPYLAVLDDPRLHPWAVAAYRLGLALVLCTRGVRAGCLLVGGSLLVGLLANRPHQSVAHTFAACSFLMLALATRADGVRLFRAQVVIVYAAATLNKVVDVDWWTGSVVEAQILDRRGSTLFPALAALFPPHALAAAVGIATIAAEAAIALGLAIPRLRGVGIALGVWFHGVLYLFLDQTFGPFLGALLIAYLLFLPAPAAYAWSPPGRFPAGAWRLLGATDPARSYGPGDADLTASEGERRWRGLAAWGLLTVRHPLPAAGLITLVALQPRFPAPCTALVVALMLLAAGWVAAQVLRSRHPDPASSGRSPLAA